MYYSTNRQGIIECFVYFFLIKVRINANLKIANLGASKKKLFLCAEKMVLLEILIFFNC